MNLHTEFPTRLHWTADQLADAVPPRLHELFAFDAIDRAHTSTDSANATRLEPTRHTRSYLPGAALHATFRVG